MHIHMCTQISETQFHSLFGDKVSKFCWGWLYCLSESVCRWACVHSQGHKLAFTPLEPEPVLLTPTRGISMSRTKISLIIIGLELGASTEFHHLCWLPAGVVREALEFLIWVSHRGERKWGVGNIASTGAGAYGKAALFCNFQNRLLTFKTSVEKNVLKVFPS